MNCPDCLGKGRLLLRYGPMILMNIDIVCSKCGGKGILNCCEGEQTQPEEKKEETADDRIHD